MTKQIFLTVLVTLSFLFSTNKVQAQTNLPPEICGRYADLNFTGTIPPGATGYWIDSTNTIINWWQIVDNTVGNGPNTIAEVSQYGQNAFAFVIHDGANYDTSAWVTTIFLQKPQVDACPNCGLIENQDVDFGFGNIVHVGHLRVDTICLQNSNSFYMLNPVYNLGEPQWSKNLNGIDFANGIAPSYNTTIEPYDTIYTIIYNSEEGNAAGDYYVLVFKSDNGNYGCSDSDTLLVSFAKQPSGTIEYRRPLCHGQEALVWAALDNEATPTEFNWDFGSNANVLDAVADATTPDSIYSVNWGTDNDCNNLLHEVRLIASSDWGCVSSASSPVYIEEPTVPSPVFNNTQPDCNQANGIIRVTNDSLVTCTDTINYVSLHKWINSTIYDYDIQVDNGSNCIIDSLYNVSSQDTSWLEIVYISFVTQDTAYVGAQVTCKDTIQVVLDDCTFVFNYSNETEINVYPNPTIESIIIEVNNKELIRNKEIITITDLTGKIVKTSVLNSDNLTLNVSEFKTGIYILKVGNTVRKFVKE